MNRNDSTQISINLKENLTAIIIGISEYPGSGDENDHSKDLPGAQNDALILADFLITKWEIPERQIHLLTGNVTQKEVSACIRTVCNSLQGKDNLLFYFSGHCSLGKGKGKGKSYMIFSNTHTSDGINYSNVLSLYFINQTLLKCKARIKLRIFDCCHSGENFNSLEEYFHPDESAEFFGTSRGLLDFFKKKKKDTSETNSVSFKEEPQPFVMTEELRNELIQNQKGWVTFCSCDLNETSEEFGTSRENMRGLFSTYLIKGLQGDAIRSEDGILYIEDLKLYIYQSMLDDYYRMPYFLTEKGHQPRKPQHMQYQCSLSGNLIVEKNKQ